MAKKHVENPIPWTKCHDEPKLAPAPCSGAHKPTSVCAQRVLEAHQRSFFPCPGHTTLPVSLRAAPRETSPPCQGCTDSRRQHLPQSKSDRQGAELPSLIQLRAGTGFQTQDFTACPLEQTTTKTTAQKHALRGAPTSTGSCLHCLTRRHEAKVTFKGFPYQFFFLVK